MTTAWTRDFTASNGSVWPGMYRVAGAAFNAEVQNNAGWAGGTAAQRFYRCSAYPQTTDYKVSAKLTWKNAVGAGRSYGLAVRLRENGERAYWVEIMSYAPGPTLNKPTVRWWRRTSSSDFQLGSDVDISSTIGSGDLNSGVSFQLRVQNEPDGDEIYLQLLYKIGGGSWTLLSSYTDNITYIWSGGTGGLVIGPNCTNDDIVVDDFVGEDFQDEAPTGDLSWEDGLGMVINGTYYSRDQLSAMGVVDVEARQGYTTAPSIVIRDNREFHDPAFRGGEDVIVTYNTKAYAWGIIRDRVHYGNPPEGNEYTLRSPKDLARGVPIVDPTTNAGTVFFNVDPENEYYQSDLANMSIGDILEWLFDNHLEGQDGLRAKLAAPGDGTAYTIPAALYTFGTELGTLTVSGDFTQAVEQILFYARSYGWFVDPDTRQHYFHKRSDSPTEIIDCQQHHAKAVMKKVPSKNRTAVLIHGGKPEIEYETWSLSDGTLEAGWDQSVGALGSDAWHQALTDKGIDNSTIGTLGIVFYQGANRLYIDPVTGRENDFIMTAGEWRGTNLNIVDGPAAPTTLRILDNSTSRIYFFADTWPNGTPSNGDSFWIVGTRDNALSDDDTEHANAFAEMFKLYQSPTAGKTLATGECIQAKQTTPLAGGGSTVQNLAGQVTGTMKVYFSTPTVQPIGLINRFPQQQTIAVCIPGNATGIDSTGPGIQDLEVQVPVLSQSVPKLRVPATGFRGTAYSHDSANWNGGGDYTPGRDDGVQDVLVIHDPSYQYPSVQDTDYTAFADEVLDALGSLCVEAQITVEDVLDDRFDGLDKKITLYDTGKRTTGYETSTDLWVMEVRWNFARSTTTLLCGTQASYQGLDLEALRKVYVDNARIKNFREQLKAYQKMKDCLKESFAFAQQAMHPRHGNECTSNIGMTHPPYNTPGGLGSGPVSPGGGGGASLDEFLSLLDAFLDWLADLLSQQKGITIDFGSGKVEWDEGHEVPGVNFTDPNTGKVYWFGNDGHWHEDTDADGIPDTDWGDNPPGWPGDAEIPGLWGRGWGYEGNGHGILIDVLADLAMTAGADETTQIVDGTITEPGTVIQPGSGGWYHPPTIFGAPTDSIFLGPGFEVPANGVTQDRAIKGLLGLSPHAYDDPGGMVYQSTAAGASNGLLYRPKPNSGDPEGGAVFENVEAVAAGTGKNGGDYATASPEVPFPTVAEQGSAGSVPEAPSDGETYARQDEGWVATVNDTERDQPDGFAGLDGDAIVNAEVDRMRADILANRPVTGDHIGQIFFVTDALGGMGAPFVWLA